MADLSKELSKELNKDFAYCEDALGRAENAIGNLPSVQPEKRTQERTETHACDSISRQMLLEYIHGEPVGRLLCDKYNLDGLIEQFPSAQPKPRWIPCSERLPDDLEEANVTWVNHNPEPYYNFVKDKPLTATAVYYKEKWYWYTSTCVDLLAEYGRNPNQEIDDDIEITAWMPLPEPYKGGEQDG